MAPQLNDRIDQAFGELICPWQASQIAIICLFGERLLARQGKPG